MQIIKTNKIIIGVVTVAILLVAYVIFDRRSETTKNEEIIENNSEQVATTTSVGQVITNPDGTTYTIEKISSTKGSIPKPIPDLNRPITKSFLATVTEKDTLIAIEKTKEGIVERNLSSSLLLKLAIQDFNPESINHEALVSYASPRALWVVDLEIESP